AAPTLPSIDVPTRRRCMKQDRAKERRTKRAVGEAKKAVKRVTGRSPAQNNTKSTTTRGAASSTRETATRAATGTPTASARGARSTARSTTATRAATGTD